MSSDRERTGSGTAMDHVSEATKRALLVSQRSEITEYHIYKRLAQVTRDPHNRDVLNHIADDEKRHYHFWKQYTGQDVEPNRFKVRWYVLIARLLGLTFGIKLMERGEEQAQETYEKITEIPAIKHIVEDEDRHERELIEMIDEERLRYVGSMVLGLNDALVELTGMLAGLTLALQNVGLIGMTGLITGIAASLSMASSEYLSTKSEQGGLNPVRAALYTGIAYIVTVFVLILPYLVLPHYLLALGVTLLNAVLIILFFTFYVSVAQDVPFKRHFLEMTGISFGVALISFGIGYLVRQFFGIDI
ncbi:MAG: VIT1/CCC1 transporter family protein [Anaerolineae bacterium]|jgi:VIT1/CCC1 family predicted Fe2+/Mn2+ transporter